MERYPLGVLRKIEVLSEEKKAELAEKIGAIILLLKEKTNDEVIERRHVEDRSRKSAALMRGYIKGRKKVVSEWERNGENVIRKYVRGGA